MEKQTIVLTNEELQQIKSLRDNGFGLSQNLGSVELQLQDLLLQKAELIETLKQLKSEEKSVLENIKTKYGEGSVNIETGEFVKL